MNRLASFEENVLSCPYNSWFFTTPTSLNSMSQWLEWSSKGKAVNRPVVDFAGKWTNELNSEMHLVVNGTQLTGTYQTGVGTPGPSQKFAITGLVNGDILGFTVSWEDDGSITCWVGELVTKGGVKTIETVWHLVQNVDRSGTKNNAWAAFLTGADTFTFVP